MDRGHQTTPLTTQLTQWDDILIDKKIVTREQCLLAKGLTTAQVADVLIAEATAEVEKKLIEEAKFAPVPHPGEDATLEELDELEDDLDDDSVLAKYREQRLAELAATAATSKFGSVLEIERSDWMREINEASKESFVVVHVFQDYLEASNRVDGALSRLATERRRVKFVRIKATAAAENWPDDRLPAVLVYKDGSIAHQLMAENLAFDWANDRGADAADVRDHDLRRLDAALVVAGVFDEPLFRDDDDEQAMLTSSSRRPRRFDDDDADIWRDDDLRP